MKLAITLIILMYFLQFCAVENIKIVALIAQRNEQNIIANFLKHMKLFADAIVVLDDASTDNSLKIIESLEHECSIEKIIKKTTWHRDEPADRNALLAAGREIGGTHFICLDADEMFTSNCLQHEYLRHRILALQPGERLALSWHQLWRGFCHYRIDQPYNPQAPFCFCDDTIGYYYSDFIHTSRAPTSLNGPIIFLPEQYGVMHFQYVEWRNLLIKQTWYKCLEHIRNPKKSCAEINRLYHKDEEHLTVKPVPAEWFAHYPEFNFDGYTKHEQWRLDAIHQWIEEYGVTFFADIDKENSI